MVAAENMVEDRHEHAVDELESLLLQIRARTGRMDRAD